MASRSPLLACALLVAAAQAGATRGGGAAQPHLTLADTSGVGSTRAMPTLDQLNWQKAGVGVIIHYNMATGKSQGCNNDNWSNHSSPASFTASGLDMDAWMQAIRGMNATYAVLVVKHNCGFLTWPTNTTLPSGERYPYGIHNSATPSVDVVGAFLAACRLYGVKPAFYYSIATNIHLNVWALKVQTSAQYPLQPGMSNVTQEQYWDLVLSQLEELWTTYGGSEIFEVWFDGGLPDDSLAPGGDSFHRRLAALRQRVIPHAIAYNGSPSLPNTIRWIGSESGDAPENTWSAGACDTGNFHPVSPDPPNGNPDASTWCPAETDSTLQQDDNWFYIDGYAIHPQSDLRTLYETSVGHNANWLLDIAPMPNGTIAPSHLAAYQQLGDWIRDCYGAPAASATFLPHAGQRAFPLNLSPAQTVDRVRLREDLTFGHLVRAFNVSFCTQSNCALVANGTSVGSGKIVSIPPAYAVIPITQVVVTTDAEPAASFAVDAFDCGSL